MSEEDDDLKEVEDGNKYGPGYEKPVMVNIPVSSIWEWLKEKFKKKE
jgi:hypothetical protein